MHLSAIASKVTLLALTTSLFLEHVTVHGAQGTVLLHRIANTAASRMSARRRNVAVRIPQQATRYPFWKLGSLQLASLDMGGAVPQPRANLGVGESRQSPQQVDLASAA